MKTTTTQITGKDIGCWIDQSQGDADMLNYRTARLAEKLGMELHPEDAAVLERFDGDGETSSDDSQILSELGDESVEYLNSLELLPYCYFEFDDNCLFLRPSVDNAREGVGFISGGDDADEEDSDHPSKEYRGEWLHVSDHGNVTLYIRGDDGKDLEVWSLV